VLERLRVVVIVEVLDVTPHRRTRKRSSCSRPIRTCIGDDLQPVENVPHRVGKVAGPIRCGAPSGVPGGRREMMVSGYREGEATCRERC